MIVSLVHAHDHLPQDAHGRPHARRHLLSRPSSAGCRSSDCPRKYTPGSSPVTVPTLVARAHLVLVVHPTHSALRMLRNHTAPVAQKMCDMSLAILLLEVTQCCSCPSPRLPRPPPRRPRPHPPPRGRGRRVAADEGDEGDGDRGGLPETVSRQNFGSTSRFLT